MVSIQRHSVGKCKYEWLGMAEVQAGTAVLQSTRCPPCTGSSTTHLAVRDRRCAPDTQQRVRRSPRPRDMPCTTWWALPSSAASVCKYRTMLARRTKRGCSPRRVIVLPPSCCVLLPGAGTAACPFAVEHWVHLPLPGPHEQRGSFCRTGNTAHMSECQQFIMSG